MHRNEGSKRCGGPRSRVVSGSDLELKVDLGCGLFFMHEEVLSHVNSVTVIYQSGS